MEQKPSPKCILYKGKIGVDGAMLTHCMQNIYVDKSSLLLWIRCISNKLNLRRKLSQNQEPGHTLLHCSHSQDSEVEA